EHLKNMIQALTRALDLADAKVSTQDLGEARYLLTRAYFAREDYYRAAVLGEDLARAHPQAARAPQAGALALAGYGQLLAAGQRGRSRCRSRPVAQPRGVPGADLARRHDGRRGAPPARPRAVERQEVSRSSGGAGTYYARLSRRHPDPLSLRSGLPASAKGRG